MPSALRFRCRGSIGAAFVVLGLLWREAPASAQEAHFFRIGAAATAGSFFEIGGVLASALGAVANSYPPATYGMKFGVRF